MTWVLLEVRATVAEMPDALGNSYWAKKGVSSAVRARKMRHTTTRTADNDYRHVFVDELEQVVELEKPTGSDG